MTDPAHPGRMLFVNMPVRSAPLRSRRAAPRRMTPSYGFMYSRSFFDLDGHGWQVMWMDPAAAEQGPEAFAASVQDAYAPA